MVIIIFKIYVELLQNVYFYYIILVRIMFLNYSKVRSGAIISKEIGIDKLINECKHFARWIEKIRNF